MSTATLTVIRGTQAGRVYPLDPGKVTTIGRRDDCDIVLLDAVVSGGCIISGATVRRSLLYSGVRLDCHALVEDSIVLPDVQIGENCVIRKCIIDSDCVIAPGTRIGVDAQEDRKRFRVTESGITLVTLEMLGQA